DERVTQPGKIAIVYSHPGEAHEYRAYLEYLHALGYVTGEVEDVELEELQGVHGLRALRVSIDLRNPKIEKRVALSDLQAATGGAGIPPASKIGCHWAAVRPATTASTRARSCA